MLLLTISNMFKYSHIIYFLFIQLFQREYIKLHKLISTPTGAMITFKSNMLSE